MKFNYGSLSLQDWINESHSCTKQQYHLALKFKYSSKKTNINISIRCGVRIMTMLNLNSKIINRNLVKDSRVVDALF